MQFLGRISYSLYLVHGVVLLALVHVLYGEIPLVALLVAVWAVSVGLATLGEIYVERPSIALGRRLTRRTAARPAAGISSGPR
jgi:peptidoglycan/LPS O-acetylase OafA/YrhL